MPRFLPLILLVAACTQASPAATLSPTIATLRVLVADDPSGTLARRAQLLAAPGTRVEVVPRPGDAGGVALADLVRAHRADASTLVTVSGALLAREVRGVASVRLGEAVPVARLGSDAFVIAVAKASAIANVAAFRERLETDPASVRFAGVGVGAPPHQLAARIVREVTRGVAGLVYASYTTVDDATAAVAADQAQALVGTYAALRPVLEAERVRALAVSSAARVPGLDVPSLRESKLDVVATDWALLVAPPGIGAAELDALRRHARRAHDDPAWADAVRRNGWIDDFTTEGMTTFVGTELARTEATLRDLELIR